jgi:hypothetical protein
MTHNPVEDRMSIGSCAHLMNTTYAGVNGEGYVHLTTCTAGSACTCDCVTPDGCTHNQICEGHTGMHACHRRASSRGIVTCMFCDRGMKVCINNPCVYTAYITVKCSACNMAITSYEYHACERRDKFIEDHLTILHTYIFGRFIDNNGRTIDCCRICQRPQQVCDDNKCVHIINHAIECKFCEGVFSENVLVLRKMYKYHKCECLHDMRQIDTEIMRNKLRITIDGVDTCAHCSKPFDECVLHPCTYLNEYSMWFSNPLLCRTHHEPYASCVCTHSNK